MIQIIGIMIGAYIFTRMLEIMASNGINIGVKIFAFITLAVAVLGIIGLLLTASHTRSGL